MRSLPIIHSAGSHKSRLRGESSKIVPTLIENCESGCRVLHCHTRRDAMKPTLLEPQRGQVTMPSGQRREDKNIRQLSGLLKYSTASRSVSGSLLSLTMNPSYRGTIDESSIFLPKLVLFTKPLIVPTDNFTLSAGEAFAMFLQDNGRAPIVGTTTDGGGGNVNTFSNATAYSEGVTRITQSVIERAKPFQVPGFPNLGYYDGVGIYRTYGSTT